MDDEESIHMLIFHRTARNTTQVVKAGPQKNHISKLFKRKEESHSAQFANKPAKES